MSAFLRLLDLSDAEKRSLGAVFTPAEISQQPAMWSRALKALRARREELAACLERFGLRGRREAVLVLTGAGSSEFVGTAVCSVLRRRLGREVVSIPTTHLVTHASRTLIPQHDYTLLSFARSGNSPESVATCDAVRRHLPDTPLIMITCNGKGYLALRASEDTNAVALVLPEETNDRSLVMTSSFSTMAFTAAGLGYLDSLNEFDEAAALMDTATRRIMDEYGDPLRDFAELPFSRACFLGSDALFGTMQECQLKMQEMSDGQVASRFESFLGLRHGPQVFVDSRCVVIAALASDPGVRRYEMDLLRELKCKGQGLAVLAICDRAEPELRELCRVAIELFPEGRSLPDDLRVMTDVVVGQILATFKSLALGLKPDSPSSSGIISRVVQGVTIYE